MKKLLLTLLWLIMAVASHAQIILNDEEKKDTERVLKAKVVWGRVEQTDTVLIVNHHPIVILPPYKFKNKRQVEKYTKLARNVKKVWPYAKIIKRVYRELTDSIAKIPDEAARQTFVKEQEKKLRAQFENELVRLSITQGKILVKLVDRETGNTTYEVLKELKGSFSAFMFQGIARLFGSNLKMEYDAIEDDKMIEDIIVRIENGTL